MSAKSKLYVPAAPAETLVTVERLSAIGHAMGYTMVHPCSPPGLKYPGIHTFRIELHAARTPYLYVRFHVETWNSNPADSFWTFREHEGEDDGPPVAMGRFPKGESRDWVLIHRCWVSQGRTANPAVLIRDGDRFNFIDPLTLYLRFNMEDNNGDMAAEAANYVKNLVVGGCPDADVPFLVTQGGGALEHVVRTNF